VVGFADPVFDEGLGELGGYVGVHVGLLVCDRFGFN
jgi:hypothetical protein